MPNQKPLVLVSNLTRKDGLQGIWYTATVTVDNTDYSAKAVQCGNFVSLF